MIPHSKPTINQEEISVLSRVLKSGFISQGRLTAEFEERFRKYIGVRYAVATNSGTSALHLALLALKIKPQEEVIIPSYVCAAVLNAVNYIGAVPKIADISSEDFNINIGSVKKKISRRTKTIIVPHMFGVAADMDGLLKLGIPVIEDCALSVGAAYKNRKAGSFGLISVYSFYATKMLTTAEGGMLLTNGRHIWNAVLGLRDYDNKEDYKIRYNYKMSDVAAAMGLAQLKRLSLFISRRQKIAQMYNKSLDGLGIQLPYPAQHKTHTYFRYIIRTDRNAGDIISRLNRSGIEAKKPVFKPLHTYLGLSDRDYPVTSQVYRTAVSLPIYPGLSDRQARFIIDKVKQVLRD